MATNKGSEVLKTKLKYRKKNNTTWKNRYVAACCGAEPDDPKGPIAQIRIYEDYERSGQKPKSIIKLESVQINSSYSGNISSSTMASPHGSGRLSVSPSSFNSGGSGSGVIDSGSGTVGGTYIFCIVQKNGDAHEFQTETENDRLRWVKLLQLLIMYPRSSIPDEPKINPIKDTLRLRLEAKNYGANSAWIVYILPDEVGSRCGIIGINVLALKSGIPGKQVGTLNIYNPADPTTPLLSWDRDKMRRTGKTGNLVFVEIGRRCNGGPGLVWMYSGFNDAQPLRETLHNFLFKGDGTAVPIHTHTPTLYDSPRPSFDANFPPSYQRENSVGSLGHSNPILSRSRSTDHDSGFVGSPVNFTSPKLEGPPVRLDKHPSIRRKRDASNPREIHRSSSTTSSMGSFSETGSVEPSCDDGQLSGHQSRSISPQDECDGDVVGCMDPESEHSGVPMYEVVSGANSQHRVMRGGANTQYEKMVNPNASEDEYVQMSKAPPLSLQNHTNPMSVPQPQAYKSTQHNKSNQQHNPVAARNNYDTLPTIREAKQQDTYVNHPLPQDLKGVPSHEYIPDYQNVELASSGERRGSLSREQSERRHSMRSRRDSDHERVHLPRKSGSPPMVGGVQVTNTPPRLQLPDNYVQFQPRNTPALHSRDQPVHTS